MKTRTIGVPREIKEDEGRVGMSPAGVDELVGLGHRVVVERGAGEGSGIEDAEFVEAGAEIASSSPEIYDQCQIIVKVKEPLESEFDLIRSDHILFTFFHFAANRGLTDAMMESGATCIAYETIESDQGHLPLLTPMSEVAGRMAVFEGSKQLEKPSGGRGLLISGIPGVESARVVISSTTHKDAASFECCAGDLFAGLTKITSHRRVESRSDREDSAPQEA